MKKKKKKNLQEKRSSNKCSKRQGLSHPIDFCALKSNEGPQKPIDYTLPQSNIIAVSEEAIKNIGLDIKEYLKHGGKILIINNIIQHNNNCQQFSGEITNSIFFNLNNNNNERK